MRYGLAVVWLCIPYGIVGMGYGRRGLAETGDPRPSLLSQAPGLLHTTTVLEIPSRIAYTARSTVGNRPRQRSQGLLARRPPAKSSVHGSGAVGEDLSKGAALVHIHRPVMHWRGRCGAPTGGIHVGSARQSSSLAYAWIRAYAASIPKHRHPRLHYYCLPPHLCSVQSELADRCSLVDVRFLFSAAIA